jgi:hypothetical protein
MLHSTNHPSAPHEAEAKDDDDDDEEEEDTGTAVSHPDAAILTLPAT